MTHLKYLAWTDNLPQILDSDYRNDDCYLCVVYNGTLIMNALISRHCMSVSEIRQQARLPFDLVAAMMGYYVPGAIMSCIIDDVKCINDTYDLS